MGEEVRLFFLRFFVRHPDIDGSNRYIIRVAVCEHHGIVPRTLTCSLETVLQPPVSFTYFYHINVYSPRNVPYFVCSFGCLVDNEGFKVRIW